MDECCGKENMAGEYEKHYLNIIFSDHKGGGWQNQIVVFLILKICRMPLKINENNI